MPGWGKLVAGAVIGAAGALYATNEEFRKTLPGKARDLPEVIQRRFTAAATAAREASALRRAEILRELEEHGGDHAGREIMDAPQGTSTGVPTQGAVEEPALRTEDV